MKRLIICVLLLACIGTAIAQDLPLPNKANPKMMERIKAARIALITERLKLTPAEAEKFWPIYREFTEQRMELRKKFQTAEQNQDAAKPKADRDKELIKLGLELKQQNVDLEKTYSEKLLKVISAEQLLALPEVEAEFRKMLLQRLQDREDMREMRRGKFQKKLQQQQEKED